MEYKKTAGNVCAPKGFTAAGVHCGIRKNRDKLDLALILAECDCSAAAVYTTNRVKAAPIYVTMETLENGCARAIICNSGNANACAPNGLENARRMREAAAKALGIPSGDVIVSSTGVIGTELNVSVIESALPAICGGLSKNGGNDAAYAIMTTDTVHKEIAIELEVGGVPVKIGGIAKGSGMIHPNMGTMLAFITTDAAITPDILHEALSECTRKTFNRISVDGDTSTNDMACVLASGLAGNALIEWKDDTYLEFLGGLKYVCEHLAKSIAADGEGASRLIACEVTGARSEEAAERLAKAVISSSLVKTALFGADANWGRVICAMGYSKAPFRPEFVDMAFSSSKGRIQVCRDGAGLVFDEALAKEILSEKEIAINVALSEGDAHATAWGCDLTYDYVRINGDYRT